MSDKAMLMFCCLLASLPMWINIHARGTIDELHKAAQNGDVATVRRLFIDEEVDLNEDVDGRALLAATAHNHLTIVELLLAHDADPTKKGNSICSALGYAVREDYQDIVRILLDNGAQATALDCHMRCPKLTAPLHLAVLEGNGDMVKLLCEYPTPLEKSLINLKNELSQSLLHDAISGEKFSHQNGQIVPEEDFLRIASYLIERGADFQVQDDDGVTPLHNATWIANIPHCELLANHGADVNVTDNKNWTPLHYACKVLPRGSSREASGTVCSFLLEHGTNINARTCDGLTPLHVAAQSGRHDLIDFLVNHGADINALDNDHNTPLNHALKYLISEDNYGGLREEKVVDAVVALISQGADIHIADCNGETPFDRAFESNNYLLAADLQEDFFTSADWANLGAKHHTAALVKALEQENSEAVLALLKYRQADPNVYALYTAPTCMAYGPYAFRLLFAAVRTGDPAVVEELIVSGADVDTKSSWDATALMDAISNENIEVVRVLLKHGAHATKPCLGGATTPLHTAAEVGNLEIIKLLCEYPAPLDTALINVFSEGDGDSMPSFNYSTSTFTDRAKRTPLHDAANYGHFDVVRYLVEQGADVHAQDYSGETPLDKAVKHTYDDVAYYLIKHGAEVNAQDKTGQTPLHKAAQESRRVSTVRLLFDAGANILARDKDGYLPLHYACMWYDRRKKDNSDLDEQVTVCSFLIYHGTPINTQTYTGATPLHTAMSSNEDVVQLLIQAGADIDALDQWKNTPLHRAGWNNVSCAKSLVEHGADLLIRNSDDQNAFDVAQARKNTKVTAYLRPYYEKIVTEHCTIGDLPDALMSNIIRHAV